MPTSEAATTGMASIPWPEYAASLADFASHDSDGDGFILGTDARGILSASVRRETEAATETDTEAETHRET